jgi:ferredoxin-NADP reductase
MNSQSAAPAQEPRSVPLLNATLIKSVPLSPSAHHLTFRVESEEMLEFLPGQSIRIEVPMQGSSMPFPYSIASPPREDNCFELCLRRGSKGSAAARLCELNEGMQVRSTRPRGVFVLQQPASHAVFLAAGTGIAPIRSMLHWLLKKNKHRQSDGRESDGNQDSRIWLIFGARDAESLFFDHEFLQLAHRHSNFHYVPTLSRPHGNWNGARGYVQDHLHHLPLSPGAIHAYLCGPGAMISSARKSLDHYGWPDDLVHYDRHDS